MNSPADLLADPYLAAAQAVNADDATIKPIGFNTSLNLRDGMFPRDATLMRQLTTGATGRLVAWDPLANRPRWTVNYPIDGALKDTAMVSFARVMTPAQAEAVRRYVIDEANWAKAQWLDGGTSAMR